MSKQITKTGQNQFDGIRHLTPDGQEYWYARELMGLLGYKSWRNFHKVIDKATKSFKSSYQQTDDHFVELNKKIKIGAGTKKESIRLVKDFKLTRLACYVIAQNGDPAKEAIALAQSYFAQQTRKHELVNEYAKQIERYRARQKLKETEKIFSSTLSQHQVDDRGIAEIRSSGDGALFNNSTRAMKRKLKIDENKPLADYLPAITIKAKDLAAEMTTFKTDKSNLIGKDKIRQEHVHNNEEIRKLLTQNSIYPEELPAEEDINKIAEKLENNGKNQSKPQLDEIDSITISIINIPDRDKITKLKDLINKNPGKKKLKIIYGSASKPKQVIRNIEFTPEILNFLGPLIA